MYMCGRKQYLHVVKLTLLSKSIAILHQIELVLFADVCTDNLRSAAKYIYIKIHLCKYINKN